jgi:hypothetical protein
MGAPRHAADDPPHPLDPEPLARGEPGAQVRLEDMGQSYWQSRFDGARRVLSMAPAEPAPAQP